MSARSVTGALMVAGVAGRPIAHSLSPLLHGAWIEAAGLDAIYAPYSPQENRFDAFVEGLRGGVIRGLNVTLPFKAAALAAADDASALAKAAGAANLLLFHDDGRIEARNTDGEGLLYAFARQAHGFDLAAGPVTIIGAGGAARGALATLRQAGVLDLRLVNRTRARAETLAGQFSHTSAFGFDGLAAALGGAGAVINASSAEMVGEELEWNFSAMADHGVAMDMLYTPLQTRFLAQAKAQGLHTVDGLDMLIGQAIPSFEALFGVRPPLSLDVRSLLLKALARR
jgi:shikimate dehydrogenase